MDPVSALSLVANIFAVVAFSKDVVDVACQIRDSGDSNQLGALEAAASNLLSAIEGMNLNPDAASLDQKSSQEDVVIFQIAQEITRTSQKITTFLNKVRRSEGQSRPSMLQTTLQALRTIWNRKATDELRKELSRVEQSLHLHATLSVKVKLEKDAIQLNDVLTTLDAHTKDLLTSKSFLANFNQLNAHHEEIKENQARVDQLAKSRHREILASLDAVRVGLGSPMFTSKEWNLEQKKSTLVLDQILASVWFPLIHDREESILSAHNNTFGWVFQDPKQSEKPWDSFSDFLEDASSETYWVSGKPGAGKSTLMKFISRHPTTKHLLQKWAGGDDFVIAGFFFHYLGSNLQKSEAGAFRSLLYQILLQRRDLIDVAFPERFRALSLSKYQPERFEPSVTELKRALKTIIQEAPATRLFLLVDGIDEYHASSADAELFVTTLRSFSAFPNVKLLVSSRPWIIFERTFADTQQLRVHDLTRPDITRFVSERFKEHRRLWDLIPGYEGALKHLMREIVDASYGVFLWVRLAVHSVLEGLTNYDTIESLRARFRALPPELEDLYRHIWDRIPHQYRTQAARYLLLVEEHMNIRYVSTDLHIRSMAFAEMDDPEFIFSTAVKPLESAAAESMCETMRGRLLSRCMGLLEVSKPSVTTRPFQDTKQRSSSDVEHTGSDLDECKPRYPDDIDQKHCGAFVLFIHRTVQEFLSSPKHRPTITMSAAGSKGSFFPVDGLLRAELMRLKKANWASMVPGHPRTAQFNYAIALTVERCLLLARHFEQAAQCPATRILAEVDRVMFHFQQTLLLPALGQTGHWTSRLENYPPKLYGDAVDTPETCDFLSLCVYYGLELFVKEKVANRSLGPTYIRRRASALLGYTLAACYDQERRIPVSLALMKFWLENGGDPNESHGCTTLWHSFMCLGGQFRWDTSTRISVIELLLVHGADNCKTRFRLLAS